MPYYPEKKPDKDGEENRKRKRTEKRRMLLRLSMAAVSCFLIIYGAVRLIGYQSELDASRWQKSIRYRAPHSGTTCMR